MPAFGRTDGLVRGRSTGRDWNWWSEASGGIGDLGVTLPLAAALVATAGFPAARLFLLWGLVYVMTGLIFRVPLSVQPLKAMAVVAIGTGLGASDLSAAAVGFGILLALLAMTGLVERVGAWFSPGLVRGIQAGIGLLLLQRAWTLVWGEGWILGGQERSGLAGVALALATVILLLWTSARRRWNLSLPVFAIGALAGVAAAGWPEAAGRPEAAVAWTLPDWQKMPALFVLLMLPQLPLTLGNAVIASADACHHYWPRRSRRISVRSLAVSIGVANVAVGFLGGFPVCHGAGGVAAHARFGGRTGRTTILLGMALIAAALLPLGPALLLRIPVPLLGALLALVGWEMVRLLRTLERRGSLAVAVVVGGVSFAARNVAIGLAAGWLLERFLRLASRRSPAARTAGLSPEAARDFRQIAALQADMSEDRQTGSTKTVKSQSRSGGLA